MQFQYLISFCLVPATEASLEGNNDEKRIGKLARNHQACGRQEENFAATRMLSVSARRRK